MNKPLLKYGLVFLAIAAPCAALFAAAPGDGRPCVPFGWSHWVVLHALALAPLGWLLAMFALRQVPGISRGTWVLAGAGVALAIFVAMLAPGLGPALDAGGAGFGERAFLRIVLVAIVSWPWLLAAAPLWPSEDSGIGGRQFAVAIVLATVAGIALPLAYERNWVSRNTAVLVELLGKQRLAAAEDLAMRLADVGSGEAVDFGGGRDSTPAQAAYKLRLARLELERRVNEPLPADAAVPLRLARANDLAALGAYEAARFVVRDAAEHNPRAAIMVAGMLQEQSYWQTSDRWFRKAIDLARVENDAVASRDKEVLLRAAYSGLAANARAQGRFTAAESIYREGIAAVPSEEAHFLFQLGRHYQLGGRPADALRHLGEAARLAPERYGEQARSAIESLRTETPACLLAPSR